VSRDGVMNDRIRDGHDVEVCGSATSSGAIQTIPRDERDAPTLPAAVRLCQTLDFRGATVAYHLVSLSRWHGLEGTRDALSRGPRGTNNSTDLKTIFTNCRFCCFTLEQNRIVGGGRALAGTPMDLAKSLAWRGLARAKQTSALCSAQTKPRSYPPLPTRCMARPGVRAVQLGRQDALGAITRPVIPTNQSLLVLGARAVLNAATNRTDSLSRWAIQLRKRRGYWEAVIAIAAKNARMARTVLTKGRACKLPA